MDRTDASTNVRFVPAERTLIWRSAFAQDEIELTDSLMLTAGARFQSGVFGISEFLPDLRLAWRPSSSHMGWISASKVARTPGRIDRDFFFPGNPPFLIRGGPDFESERGRVYEIGYRASPTPRSTFSVTVFHQELEGLRGGSFDNGGFIISNEIEGRTRGLEAWALVQPFDNWRLMAGWMLLDSNLHPRAGSTDAGGPAALGNDPRHTVKLRSLWRVRPDLDLDVNWRYVSALAFLATVPSYSSTDVRLAWRMNPSVELSLLGSDIFHASHVEFDEHGLPAKIPRALYAQVRWQF